MLKIVLHCNIKERNEIEPALSAYLTKKINPLKFSMWVLLPNFSAFFSPEGLSAAINL